MAIIALKLANLFPMYQYQRRIVDPVQRELGVVPSLDDEPLAGIGALGDELVFMLIGKPISRTAPRWLGAVVNANQMTLLDGFGAHAYRITFTHAKPDLRAMRAPRQLEVVVINARWGNEYITAAVGTYLVQIAEATAIQRLTVVSPRHTVTMSGDIVSSALLPRIEDELIGCRTNGDLGAVRSDGECLNWEIVSNDVFCGATHEQQLMGARIAVEHIRHGRGCDAREWSHRTTGHSWGELRRGW